MADQITLYQQRRTTPLRHTTLTFLYTPTTLLLAMKKRGFGEGKWNGMGGKQENNESIEETAKRELHEEIGITALNLTEVALLTFFYPFNSQSDQMVHVFLVKRWKGTPLETEEMRPQWFTLDRIPYESMWPDDKIWLPYILNGNFVKATFLFNVEQSIVAHNIFVVPRLP